MWNGGCGMWNVGCGMWNVGCGIWNGACGTGMFSHRSQMSTETMRGALSKKHETRRSPTDRRGGNITDAHGWVFSRIVYTCSAAYCLGFDAPPAQRIDTDFFAGGELCGRMSHDGLAWYAKNLWKSARSVGDNYAHNALKHRLDVFILPRISQISTDAMRGACQ